MCSVDLSTGQALSQAVYQIVWCGSRFCPSVSSACSVWFLFVFFVVEFTLIMCVCNSLCVCVRACTRARACVCVL